MAIPPNTPVITRPDIKDIRFSALVWGDPGSGKTTLSATGPGEKLYFQFDRQGWASIANRNDIHLVDRTAHTVNDTMMEFNKTDIFGIRAYIKLHPGIETVIVDSLSTLADNALIYAVTRTKNSSYDIPGMNGWGTRNQVMRRVVSAFLQACGELNLNLIVVAHEGAPDKDEGGMTTSIGLSLSDSLAKSISMHFNEVWYMKDTGTARQIYVRPFGPIKPMKTRMFDASKSNGFLWHFNADELEGEGVADWLAEWQQNGGKKIPLPTKK